MLEKNLQQTTNADRISDDFLRKAYLCCFTQFTVDQSKLTVNGSVLSDTPNVRYLVALYICYYILHIVWKWLAGTRGGRCSAAQKPGPKPIKCLFYQVRN